MSTLWQGRQNPATLLITKAAHKQQVCKSTLAPRIARKQTSSCVLRAVGSPDAANDAGIRAAEPEEAVLRGSPPNSALECTLDVREAEGQADFREIGWMRATAYYEVH